METIIVNGRIFRSEKEARTYCETNGLRVSGTETIYRRGKRSHIWTATNAPADPAAGYIAAQENAYFDKFCSTL